MSANRGVLAILVRNRFGVLTKVTGLFSRRGYNIHTISAGETQKEAVTRITVVTEGDEAQLLQIASQVRKLEDVRAVHILSHGSLLDRELCLIKVAPQPGGPDVLEQLAGAFHGSTTQVPGGGFILEASGAPAEIDELIKRAQGLGIVEISRTGATALTLDQGALAAQDA